MAEKLSSPATVLPENQKTERKRRRLRLPAFILAGSLALGAITAETIGQETGSAKVLGHSALISTNERLSTEPQISVDDEARMRFNAEKQRKGVFLYELTHSPQYSQYMQAIAEALKPRIPYDYNLWIRLHNCEQPGTWHAGGHFGNGLRSGGNGLGMSVDAWSMGVEAAAEQGVTLPASGWDANIDEQMQAAQAFLKKNGWGWACHV